MRKFAIILVSLLIMANSSLADTNERFIICNPASCVIVRISPNKSSCEAGRLECGDSFTTDGKEKNGYVHVIGITENGEGWVYAGYVVDDCPDMTGCNATIAATGRVAARRNVNGQRIGWVNVCTDVHVYAQSEEWAVTSAGYIKTEYLEVWE